MVAYTVGGEFKGLMEFFMKTEGEENHAIVKRVKL
jgi:hypothetical protein